MSTKKDIDIFFKDIIDSPSIYAKDHRSRKRMRTIDDTIIIPMENEAYLPYMKVGIALDNPYTQQMVIYAHKNNLPVFITTLPESTKPDKELTEEEEMEEWQQLVGRTGCIAMIVDTTGVDSEGILHALVHTGFQGTLTFLEHISTGEVDLTVGTVEEEALKYVNADKVSDQAVNELLESTYLTAERFLNEQDRKNLHANLDKIEKHTLRWLHFMIQNSPVDWRSQYDLLCIKDIEKRRERFLELLTLEMQKLLVKEEMQRRTASQLSKRQKEEFLRSQIRTMQDELGMDQDDDELDELRERASKKEWSEETAKAFEKEMRRLMRYSMNSPEYALQYSYLDTFLDLPWNHCDNEVFELADVERILDRDHYGLEKVKERIVEQMAVIKLRNDLKAPILCFYGPPGVGKTSLGKSIAEALGRKYVRVALGGIHDESEIRGHRRTYLGSMPGRIISALEKCGTSNPVMMLDEIDKIGSDFKGDPSTALLEVLDPEQNCRFHDNYIDHDYDLSKVLFIATANNLQTVSAPLLDRMELIEIGSYVEDEKIQIALRHLLPKTLVDHGFDKDEVKFSPEAVAEIISEYTRESGVRRLEKRISDVLRKLARLKASGKEFPHVVDETLVREYLGKPDVIPDSYENNDKPGVVTGLAWTQAGGEILFIESALSPGKGDKLTLTGNLGTVMKESAMIALQYLKSNAKRFGIDIKKFEENDMHIHVPEGAIPKDGPSAGITMLTSLASTFTGRKVAPRLAMTGEFTLRGRVLPVGGIKEKILAAKRAGINTVILCEKNRKDIEEINSRYLEGMNFHFVESASEVLELALLEETAD